MQWLTDLLGKPMIKRSVGQTNDSHICWADQWLTDLIDNAMINRFVGIGIERRDKLDNRGFINEIEFLFSLVKPRVLNLSRRSIKFLTNSVGQTND